MTFRAPAASLLSLLPATLLVVACPGFSDAQVATRNMQLLGHVDEYHVPEVGQAYAYSACWSYIHPDGREYAVLGTSGGTAIYNVTNPSAPYRVGFIPGPPSIWREIKQYRNWIYVVTEGHGALQGLQIVRMTDPENPVLATTFTSPTLVSAHTVTVDSTRALLVTNGTKSDAGGGAFPYTGMRLFSLANPEAPQEIGVWPSSGVFDGGNYVHDAVIVGNKLYASLVYSGTETVFDITNPSNPSPLSSWTYPGAYYTHNAWPDASGHYLYVTDERNGQTLRVFDISDLSSPVLINGISSNPAAIVHNAHVLGQELYVSNYTEGIRALDLSDPAHPAEFGWADSYPGASGGYGGVWEVCPFFPSGTVIASDMQSGLYVYRPVRNYGLLRVIVRDDQGQPLPNVRVRLASQGDSLVTPADGVVRFAPSPGNHVVTADRFGYGRTSASLSLAAGARDSVTLTLRLLPTTTFDGTIQDRASHAPLEGGEVDLLYTELQAFTDATGTYQIDGIPDDDYRVAVHRPGYVPLSFDRHIGIATDGEAFTLAPAATWDPLEVGGGWTVGVASDEAQAGRWLLAAPVGTGTSSSAAGRVRGPASPATLLPAETGSGTLFQALAPSSACGDPRIAAAGSGCAAHVSMADASSTAVATASGGEPPTGHCGCGTACVCAVVPTGASSGQIKPANDRSPGSATRCFVTGQAIAGTGYPDDYDLDGGRTTLTSPAFDMRGMSDPVIGWWRWFYSRYGGTGQPETDDWLAVFVSSNNGATWVAVDTTRGIHNSWEEQAIHVAKYVNPNSHVRVRFVAADYGNDSTVEAAVDDITTYDGAQSATGVPETSRSDLQFAAPSPNPFSTEVALSLELPRAGRLTVEVLDIVGRRMTVLHSGPAAAGPLRLTWDGHDDRNGRAPAGIYFVEARIGGQTTRTKLIRMP